MSTEEFVACLIARGFAVADMDKFTMGQLINFMYEHDRLQRMAAGEEVPDLEARYRQLKAAQPVVEERHRKGEITEEEYSAYCAALLEWEE